MKDVMVDLETMGCGYRAAIVAIGAMPFNPLTGEVGNPFYRTINLESCQAEGQKIDASTVLWWMMQEPAARSQVLLGESDLPIALAEFAAFLGKGMKVWGNGSNFDNRILREAYELVDQPCPWHYTGDRDMRTLCAVAKSLGVRRSAIEFAGTKHNALDDARHQARIVCDIYQELSYLASGGG